MYWSFTHRGSNYVSWGSPRFNGSAQVRNLKARYDIGIYDGDMISRDESVCFLMQGDATLGLGDSIWLMSYMRDIYNIKGRSRCNFTFCSSPWVLDFYGKFLPKSFNYLPEYMTEENFSSHEHHLPAMYYWHDQYDNADRSWVDNRSLVERLYNWSGMEYKGLPNWSDFTSEEILYPSDDFWTRHGLDKNDKFVYFQWHSSGHAKNVSPRANVKLLKHITKKYGVKVYVVGRLKSLDMLEDIPGVVNLSGKTEGEAEALFTLAFNSEFIVCPDSAGVHLSEAYKIPSVCIMSTLPPSYICSKYKIPAFMYGSGKCGHKPCGIVHALPKDTKCPPGTGDYCKVMEDVDLDLFDKCVKQSFRNRHNYRRTRPIDFYEAMNQPISLVSV